MEELQDVEVTMCGLLPSTELRVMQRSSAVPSRSKTECRPVIAFRRSRHGPPLEGSRVSALAIGA